MARIRWDGDASTAVRAQEALTAAQKKYEEQCGKSVKKTNELEKEAKEAAAAEQKLVEAANKIKEAIDPQTKLNRLTQEHAAHVKAGRLSIEQATASLVKHRDQLGLSALASQKVAKANDDAFGSKALTNIGAYLTGMVSIGSAISLIRGELASIVAINEEAAQKTLTAAGAEAALRETVAGDSQRDRLIAAAGKIADEFNLPQAATFRAIEQAYAAGGDADLAIRSISSAARQTRDPERLVQTAAGIGDIVQTTTIKDTEQAAGFLALTQQTSRIVGEKVAAAAGKTAASFVAAGGTEAAAAAMLSALSVAGADPEGERSRTAAIQFIQKSADFFSKNRAGLKPEQFDTPDERIALLMADEKLGRKFLDQTKFEAPMVGAMSKLLLSPETKAIYAKAFSINDEAAERIAASRGRASFITEGGLQAASLTEAAIDTEREKLELEIGKKGILTAEAREKLLATMAEAQGVPMFVQRLEAFVNTGATMTRKEAIEEISRNKSTFDGSGSPAAQKALRDILTELQGLNRKSGARAATREE